MASKLLSGQINALTLQRSTSLRGRKEPCLVCQRSVHTASHHKRVLLCQSLLQEGLETFGDPSSWQKFLGKEAQCHRSVDYYTELPDVYRRSDINFNITSCQMPSTVNQRLFDVPLAGGFLLTDPQKDATELFREGEEVVVYRSIEEAKDWLILFRLPLTDTISRAAAKRIRRALGCPASKQSSIRVSDRRTECLSITPALPKERFSKALFELETNRS